MARRKNEKGLVEIVLVLPWWVNFFFGCISFILLRWILPTMFNSSPQLAALAKLSYVAAFVPAIFFGAFASIQFVRSKAVVNKKSTDRNPQVVTQVETKIPVDIYQLIKIHNADSGKLETPIRSWNIESLRALEWKRFELLTAKYYEMLGFRSETIRCGADGGIDVKLFKSDLIQPVAIVQCKAWNTSSVGVKEVRELLGVMTHEKVKRGIFITTGTYTTDALNFGASNPIQMLDGAGFISKLATLTEQQQQELILFAFKGDYSTPTCASCGIKMTKRESKRGPFWGCLNYPRCKSKFPISV